MILNLKKIKPKPASLADLMEIFVKKITPLRTKATVAPFDSHVWKLSFVTSYCHEEIKTFTVTLFLFSYFSRFKFNRVNSFNISESGFA